MKIATICTPSSALFLPAVERLLREGGHEVTRFDGDNILVPPHDAYWVEWAGYAAAFASNTDLRGAPLVVRLHRYEVDEPHFLQIRWENVSALVVTSEHVAARARAVVPDLDQRTRVVVIPSIVDFERFSLQTREPSDVLRVAVLGNINGRKQPGLAAAMFRAIAAEWRASLTFIGTPADPWWEPYVRSICAPLAVQFRPWTDDPVGIWREHDVLLSASADEGCPYSPIEALACGASAFVHRYPGAEAQFPAAMLWGSPRELARKFTDEAISETYATGRRAVMAERYSIEANRAAVLALFGGAA